MKLGSSTSSPKKVKVNLICLVTSHTEQWVASQPSHPGLALQVIKEIIIQSPLAKSHLTINHTSSELQSTLKLNLIFSIKIGELLKVQSRGTFPKSALCYYSTFFHNKLRNDIRDNSILSRQRKTPKSNSSYIFFKYLYSTKSSKLFFA